MEENKLDEIDVVDEIEDKSEDIETVNEIEDKTDEIESVHEIEDKSDEIESVHEIKEAEHNPLEIFYEGSDKDFEYKSDYTLKDLKAAFTKYSESWGLSRDNETINELFASLASFKLILLDGEKKVCDALSSVVNSFFASSEVSVIDKTGLSILDLIEDKENPSEDYLVRKLKTLKYTRRLSFLYIENAKSENMNKYLADLEKYLYAPNLGYKLDSSKVNIKSKEILIPANFYILAQMKKNDDYIKNSIVINVRGSVSKLKVTKNEETISFNGLNDIFRYIRDNYYLSDSIWNKFDSFNNDLGNLLGNVLVRRVEAYSSIFFKLNRNESKTIDLFMSKIVIPYLNSVKHDADIKELLNTYFKEYDLENTFRMLEVK